MHKPKRSVVAKMVSVSQTTVSRVFNSPEFVISQYSRVSAASKPQLPSSKPGFLPLEAAPTIYVEKLSFIY